MKKRKPLVLFIYENDLGGEFVETELIFKEFKKRDCFNLKRLKLPSLTKTHFVGYFTWLFRSLYKSLCFIIHNKPEIIYTTTFTAGFAASILKNILGLKIFFHYHGNRIPPKFIDASIIHQTTQLTKYYFVYGFHKIFILRADAIIVPSGFTKMVFLDKFHIEKNKVIIIPNGIDLLRFPQSSVNETRIYKNLSAIIKNRKVILTVGRLNNEKNFIGAIKAFKHLLDITPNNFVILLMIHPLPKTVEEINYKSLLNTEVRKLGPEKKVFFIEGKRDLSAFYKKSDLFLSLSNVENFPIVMLEAFASGLLYSCAPAGATESVLRKIDPVLIINEKKEADIAKHLLRLLRLPRKQKQQILASERAFVGQHSIKETSGKLHAIFKSRLTA